MLEDSGSQSRTAAERRVGIGELDVVQGTGILRTLLGSCIGLVLHDPVARVGGMAHVVLPESCGRMAQPGKYADTAIPELIRRMQQCCGRRLQLIAKLAGGARMFGTSESAGIGGQNLEKVERLLEVAGIPVLGQHCGGRSGRRMAFDVQSGRVTVEIVGAPPVDL